MGIRRGHLLVSGGVVLHLLWACQTAPAPGFEEDRTSTPAPAPLVVYEDVAPILANRCVSCHQSGGIAPFSLATYDEVRAYGAAARSAIQERRMPPWPVRNDGSCQTYRDARWLTAQELSQLTAWIDAGMPRREATYVSPPPPIGEAPAGSRTALVDMGVSYTPQGNAEYPDDDYRCFLVESGVERDAFVTGFEVEPGVAEEVHHLFLYTLDAADQAAAMALDAQDAAPGWPCFGGAGQGITVVGAIAAWTPGKGTARFPQDTGLFVPGGQQMILQIHYNLSNAQLPDRTRIRLGLEDTVLREARFWQWGDYNFTIPPGQTAAVIEHEQSIESIQNYFWNVYHVRASGIDIFGIYPHMHLLGTEQRVSLIRTGDHTQLEQSCLTDVPDWDFHWQDLYFYEQPVRASAGQSIYIRCTYDTSGEVRPVSYGEGTGDEMCLTGFYLAPVTEGGDGGR